MSGQGVDKNQARCIVAVRGWDSRLPVAQRGFIGPASTEGVSHVQLLANGRGAMPVRDVYLRIETIPGYSPVQPDDHMSPPQQYRRDCMRNPGHEDGTIPADEVDARRLTALIYREYLDSHYLIPKPDKLVLADVNEPAFNMRVPGTVIYTRPGDRLRIHVKNV